MFYAIPMKPMMCLHAVGKRGDAMWSTNAEDANCFSEEPRSIGFEMPENVMIFETRDELAAAMSGESEYDDPDYFEQFRERLMEKTRDLMMRSILNDVETKVNDAVWGQAEVAVNVAITNASQTDNHPSTVDFSDLYELVVQYLEQTDWSVNILSDI